MLSVYVEFGIYKFKAKLESLHLNQQGFQIPIGQGFPLVTPLKIYEPAL